LPWIVGPSAGALLFRYVDDRAPAVVAASLFAINLVLAAVILKSDNIDDEGYESDDSNCTRANDAEADDGRASRQRQSSSSPSKARHRGAGASILSNLKFCFSSKTLGSVVAAKLIVTLVSKATSYSQLGSFYEDMYGLEPHHRGYISSYQQALQFIVQSTLVDRVLNLSGGERRATYLFTGLLAVAVLMEIQRSLLLFLLVLCPIISLSFAMQSLSLQTLVTQVAPKKAIFSVLAALDVLQNIVSVSMPVYRTVLFRVLASDQEENAMEGDPDPVAWIVSSAGHWIVASIAISCLLLPDEKAWKEDAASSARSTAASSNLTRRKEN